MADQPDRRKRFAGNAEDLHVDRPAAARTLTDADVDAIAEAIVEKLTEGGLTPRPRPTTMLTAQQLADALGLTRDYVYEHKVDLGAMYLGDGPGAHLRFDLETARRGLENRQRRRAGPRARRATR